MYLVDTSVLIAYFQGLKNQGVNFLQTVLDHDLPCGITGIIYQEILQGISNSKQFETTASQLLLLKIYHPKSIHTYQNAAQLYRDCRRQGITIRSTTDCLIAQIAIENNLTLIHSDKDYNAIKKCHSKLRLFSD